MTARHLLADNTIDTMMYDLVEQKRRIAQAALDGQETTVLGQSVMYDVLATLAAEEPAWQSLQAA